MSNPVPLPPLGDLFEGDETARCAYSRLLPLEEQKELAIRILGQMLLQAPSPAGRRYVAESINRCATDHEILQLGESHLGVFIKYFQEIRAMPVYSSCPSLDDIPPDSLVAAPTSHEEAKKQALVRDNYRCVLSGTVESKATESLPWLSEEVVAAGLDVRNTRCCYILPGSVGPEDVEQFEHQDRSSIWTIACLFGGISKDQLREPRVQDLRNILTLETGIQACFARFQIWLEPTGTENQYFIRRREEYHCRGLPEVITFSSTSPNLALPDPQYLALHAAFGRVIKLTGAAEFTARFFAEVDETGVLSEDGSSGELLNRLLAGESLRVF